MVFAKGGQHFHSQRCFSLYVDRSRNREEYAREEENLEEK
jgi:hypothetical protein